MKVTKHNHKTSKTRLRSSSYSMRSAKTFTKTSFLKVSNTTWTLSVETVVIVEKIKMATPSVMMPIVATRSVMTKNAPRLKLEIG